ncbi:DUF3515 domain-containing protein, partial [Streptomyces durbertensis]|uniref:DUF3515 domain-containing protein n=1 Tax=Streptomyces durbertensis TaxID=2448886 RepID=UPI001889A3D3
VWRGTGGPSFDVERAPRADAPECVRLLKRLPDELAGRGREDVRTQGVAVWGDGDVVLRCGLRPPPPSVDPCVAVDDVEWLLLEARSQGDRKVLLTYGRDPAVEVSLSQEVDGVDAALIDLSRLVEPIRQRGECIGEEEPEGLGG